MILPKAGLSPFILVLVVGTCMLITIGCSDDSVEGSADGRLHPYSDLIPTYEVETYAVTKDEAVTAPISFMHLSDDSESLYYLQSTGILVGDASTVRADQIGEDRIAVLDLRHHHLMVYDTEAGRIDTLAVNDGAPDNVANATGMDVHGDTIFVSTMDYRLQTYRCAETCLYVRTTTLDFSARDVAARNGRISLLGLNYDQDEEDYGLLSQLLHRMAGEEVAFQFMDAYGSTNPLVAYELNDGFPAHAGGYDVFAFTHMPYLYVFEEGNPVAMFEIDEFYLMEREEGVEPYSISVGTAAAMSRISRIQNYSDNELVVVVGTTDRGRRVESLEQARQIDPDDVSVNVDYYFINMASMRPAYLGSTTFDADGGPHVIPTRDFEIVIADGEVKYVRK